MSPPLGARRQVGAASQRQISANMTIGPGTRLGRYEIVSRLGAGGMGEVYLAGDPILDRTVALKFLADRPGAGSRDTLLRVARRPR